MKRNILFVVIATIFISGSYVSTVYASGAHVRILDLSRDVICDTSFTGTRGMDSIINTAESCGFVYSLGYGDDFLDDINGISWDGTNWWALYVDGAISNVGVNEYDLDDVSEILWVFSDGSYVPPIQSVSAIVGGGVIVGLMSPHTGGLLDSDGDEVSDKDERIRGTDPYVQEKEYVQAQEQIAAVVEAVGWLAMLTDIFVQLQMIMSKI